MRDLNAGDLGQTENWIAVIQRTTMFRFPNVMLSNCFQIPFNRSRQHGIRNMIWEAKTRRRNNLPEGVVSPSLVSIDEELFSGTTWPKLTWKLEENLCIYHHITFLYGLCFPPLRYYYFSSIKNNTEQYLLII